MKTSKALLLALSATALTTSAASAMEVLEGTHNDTFNMPESPNAIMPSEDKLSGSISLDINSHFISYGADVWGAGSSATREITFNPSASFAYAVTDKFSLNTGFWLDVNDNTPDSVGRVQETDIWLGASYTQGIATYSVTYQNWQYAGDSEQVLDLAVSFDTFLNPSILIHKRIEAGAAAAAGGSNGTFLVLGVDKSFDISDKLSLTIPVSVGFALDDFHTTESGYAYTSVGLQASYAINDFTSFNAGVSYYNSDVDVTAATTGDFLTYNAGISFSF